MGTSIMSNSVVNAVITRVNFSRFTCRNTIYSDVWSYGVLMWEVFTFGCRPYYELGNKHVKSAVLGGHRLQCPKGCPNELCEIMKKCWATEPAERISAAEAEEDLTSIFQAMKTNQPRVQTWPSTDPHDYLSCDDVDDNGISSDSEEEITSVPTKTSPTVAAADTIASDDSTVSEMLTVSDIIAHPNTGTNPLPTPNTLLEEKEQFSPEAISLKQSTAPVPAGYDIELVHQQRNCHVCCQ